MGLSVSKGSRFFWAACLAYALMAYGVTRSPDAEVTFRVGESLADHLPPAPYLPGRLGLGVATLCLLLGAVVVAGFALMYRRVLRREAS